MAARTVEIHPEALAEAKAAIAWYAERSSRAPQAFLEEVDKALDSILDSPRRWPMYEAGCRRFPLVRFPYLVVYREKPPNIVEVVAIAHGRRKPGYWRNR